MLVVDRLEGEWAVVETQPGNTRNIPLARLPAGVREGDVLRPDGCGGFAVDEEQTRLRRERIQKSFGRLFE